MDEVQKVTPNTVAQVDFSEVTQKYMDSVKIIGDKIKRRKEIIALLEDMVSEYSERMYEGGSWFRYGPLIKVYKQTTETQVDEEAKSGVRFAQYFNEALRFRELGDFVEKHFPGFIKFGERIVIAATSTEGQREIDEEATKQKRREFRALVDELRHVENELEVAESTKRELKDYVRLFKDIKQLTVDSEVYDNEYED